MSNFIVLIKNEFIKLFARRSTIVILILIAALALGSMAISIPAGGYYEEIMDYGNTDWWENEAEWIEQEFYVKDENGEYVDKSDYAYEMRARAKVYRFMLETGIDNTNDWRYRLIYEDMWAVLMEMDLGKVTAENEAKLEAIKAAAKNDDWRGYYTELREGIMSSESLSDIQKDAYAFEYNYYLENDLKPGSVVWKDSLLRQAANAKQSLVPYLEAEKRGEEIDPKVTEEYRNKLAVALYQLDNDIQYNAERYFENERRDGNYWSYFVNTKGLLTVIGIMMIVIAGKIVAEEYSAGTIKFLLISPAKRYKILLAKYLTVLIMGFMMMAILYLSSAILALPFSGGEGLTSMVIRAKDGVVKATSPFVSLLSHYALQSVGMIVMATMAFAISSLMRSTAVSVGVGISAYAFGLLGATLLADLGLDVGRYLIFSNLNLADIAKGEAIYEYQTLPMALVVIAVHMVVFALVAHDAFVRRDI